MPSVMRIKPARVDATARPAPAAATRAPGTGNRPVRLKTVSGSLLVQPRVIGSGFEVLLVNNRNRYRLSPANDEVAVLLEAVTNRKSTVVQYGTARGELVAGRGGTLFRVVELRLGLASTRRR